MNTQIPDGYELLPAPFLREHGAVDGMKYRWKHKEPNGWLVWVDNEIGKENLKNEVVINNYDFIAPLGTIAATTTPLPEWLENPAWPDAEYRWIEPFTGKKSNANVPASYRHILPGELAKMPTKPEGLLVCSVNQKGEQDGDWIEPGWPLALDGDFAKLLAYTLPLPPQPDKGKGGEGEGKSAADLIADVKAIRKQAFDDLRALNCDRPAAIEAINRLEQTYR